MVLLEIQGESVVYYGGSGQVLNVSKFALDEDGRDPTDCRKREFLRTLAVGGEI